MPTELNRGAFARLIAEDVEWLRKLAEGAGVTHSLELDHINHILREAELVYYSFGTEIKILKLLAEHSARWFTVAEVAERIRPMEPRDSIKHALDYLADSELIARANDGRRGMIYTANDCGAVFKWDEREPAGCAECLCIGKAGHAGKHECACGRTFGDEEAAPAECNRGFNDCGSFDNQHQFPDRETRRRESLMVPPPSSFSFELPHRLEGAVELSPAAQMVKDANRCRATSSRLMRECGLPIGHAGRHQSEDGVYFD
jgi:hypothetical protein